MATLYENYITGDETAVTFYGNGWSAQTFTPSSSHTITSVKLKMYRYNSPGTITVSIKATDDDGHPTGDDLCSGTTNGNTLPLYVDTHLIGEWREITLGAGSNLLASTKYAIVIRALSGDADNQIYIHADDSSPAYADGNYEGSVNAGVAWTAHTNIDLMFEDWGIAWTPFTPKIMII